MLFKYICANFCIMFVVIVRDIRFSPISCYIYMARIVEFLN